METDRSLQHYEHKSSLNIALHSYFDPKIIRLRAVVFSQQKQIPNLEAAKPRGIQGTIRRIGDAIDTVLSLPSPIKELKDKIRRCEEEADAYEYALSETDQGDYTAARRALVVNLIRLSNSALFVGIKFSPDEANSYRAEANRTLELLDRIDPKAARHYKEIFGMAHISAPEFIKKPLS